MNRDEIKEIFFAGYSTAMEDCDAVHDASDVKEIKYLMEMFDISFMYWLDYKKGEKWLR